MLLSKTLFVFISIINLAYCTIDSSLYIGCYQDLPYDRDFKNFIIIPNMTIELCLFKCKNMGFNYIGLQYSNECYCDNIYGRFGKTKESDCNYKCQGNSSQTCGGLKSNSVWKIDKDLQTINSTVLSRNTNRNIVWFNLANFTQSEWSIFYPIDMFLSSKIPIRLFDLIDMNMYASVDYFQDSFKLELNILFNNNFDKRMIQLNKSQFFPIFSMILVWRNPVFAIFINCKLAGKIMFSSVNDINIMSLPYIKPNLLSNFGCGIIYNPVRLALVKAKCVDNNFDFPKLMSSFYVTTPSSSSFTVTNTPTTSAPIGNQSLNIETAEWSFLFNFLIFQPMIQTLRLFDFVDRDIYVNGNYIKDSSIIELCLFHGKIYQKRVIVIEPSFLPITNMIISWKYPNLVVHVNCKHVSTMSFSAYKEQAFLLSLPYLKPNVVAAGGCGQFFYLIKDALIESRCVANDFKFPTILSNSNMPIVKPNATNNSTFGIEEWAIIFPSRLFKHTATVIRLVNFDLNNVYVSIDFFPLESTIEVTILIDRTYTKRILNIDSSTLMPIQFNLMITWKNPLLVFLIDCKYAGQLLYLTQSHTNSLSLPYFNQHLTLSNVNHMFYRSIRQALIHFGCVSGNFEFPITLNATAVLRPTFHTTSTTQTTTSTSLPSTTYSSYVYTNNSLPYLTNDFTTDSDFILLVYSTRVSQYKNLLDLTNFLDQFEYLNKRLYELSLINFV